MKAATRVRFMQAKLKFASKLLEDPPPIHDFESMNLVTLRDVDNTLDMIIKLAGQHRQGKFDAAIAQGKAQLRREFGRDKL